MDGKHDGDLAIHASWDALYAAIEKLEKEMNELRAENERLKKALGSFFTSSPE